MPPVIDTSTPAVVLKFDPNVLHHGGLGVIRSLGRHGVPVYGLHESKWAPAAYSRYLRTRWRWRPVPTDADRVVRELREIGRGIGRPAVLLPTDDVGAIFLAEYGARLRDMFRFAAAPTNLPRTLVDKHSMYQLCRRLGACCPESVLAWEWRQVRAFVRDAGLPLVVKRVGAAAEHTPMPSTTIVHDLRRLRWMYDLGRPLLVQEYIPGEHGLDWFFHGYCDREGRCHPAFTGMKERSYPAHAGLTSLGRAVHNDTLRRDATDLLRQLAFSGIVDLDYRLDRRDGRYKLLDFNPRLGAQFRLFQTSAGVDVALAAYLDLTGQSISDTDIPQERRFLVENYDPLSALGYWRRGELGMRSWLSSLRAVDEKAWLAGDDVLPFVLMCLWMGWRGVSRPWTGKPRHEASETRLSEGIRA